MPIYLPRTALLRNTRFFAPRSSPTFCIRLLSSTESSTFDIRTKLRDDLKQSMRAKDTFRTTTIRSVLAEITNTDKSNKDKPISQDTIYSLIQKSITRRNDSASQFRSASRTDLAQKEEDESVLLSSFLPPQLSDSEIDQRLQTAFASLQNVTGGNPGAIVGKLLKAFYETSERASVKAEDVSRRAKEIVQSAAGEKS